MKVKGLRQWLAGALKKSGGRGKELAFLFEQPEGENDIVFDLHIHDSNSDGARQERNLFITAGSDTHDYYSYQGNKTQVGIAPGVGEDYSQKDNPIYEMAISTYNLHYIGSGAYIKNKNKNTEECLGR